MKLGTKGEVANVITCTKFLVNWSRGYGVPRPQSCRLPISSRNVTLTTVFTYYRATLWFVLIEWLIDLFITTLYFVMWCLWSWSDSLQKLNVSWLMPRISLQSKRYSFMISSARCWNMNKNLQHTGNFNSVQLLLFLHTILFILILYFCCVLSCNHSETAWHLTANHFMVTGNEQCYIS